MSGYKPICPDAWAIPPSPIMLEHGNDYHTCSKCGEPCQVVELHPDHSQRADESDITISFSDLVQLVRCAYSHEAENIGYARAAKIVEKAIEPQVADLIAQHDAAIRGKILEALPEKRHPEVLSYYDAQERAKGFNDAIDQCSEAVQEVFGDG